MSTTLLTDRSPTVSSRFTSQAGLGPIFLAGIGLVALLLIYEHSLVRPDNLEKVNQAFFHVNAVISLGLFVVGLIDLWWQSPH